jgi:hypothetical protein
MSGAETIDVLLLKSSVCPSGFARAAKEAPITPLPPGRFSTTNRCPIFCAKRSANTRELLSMAPPAVVGVINVTGRVG